MTEKIYHQLRSDRFSYLLEPHGLLLQIFIGYSSGRVIEHECTGHEELLVKNLCCGNYRAAAFGVVNFVPLKKQVLVQVGKEIKKELRSYSRDSHAVFKYHGDLEKLAEYRNEQLMEEAKKKVPIVHTLVTASFPKKDKYPLNKEALIISSFLNPWIPKSNFIYRNNTILILGGCKTEEIDCLHRLGLSSHNNTLRNMQKKASLSHDKLVLDWRDDIAHQKMKIRLMEEVLQKQLETTGDDAMEVSTVDFSAETVSNCSSYTEAVYRSCKEMLPECSNDLYEDTDLLSVLSTLKEEELPKFR